MGQQSLTIAFWNVCNLFVEGTHPSRAPKTLREREAKVDALASVIRRLAGGDLPNVLALAEVADESLVHDLVKRLPVPSPLYVFENSLPQHTGIAVVGFSPSIAAITRIDAEMRDHRPRSLSVRVTLTAPGAPSIYVIACHWKSNLYGGGASRAAPHQDRRQSGRWLFDHISGSNAPNGKVDPIIVLGDFNAEPYAPEISASNGLHATRHKHKSLRANGIRLFNCMWPWLVDHAFPIPRQNSNLTTLPLMSHGQHDWQVLDHVLVSRSILREDVFRLAGVQYHCEDGITAHLLPQSQIPAPYAWSWNNVTNQGIGTSDHFPLVASLEY